MSNRWWRGHPVVFYFLCGLISVVLALAGLEMVHIAHQNYTVDGPVQRDGRALVVVGVVLVLAWVVWGAVKLAKRLFHSVDRGSARSDWPAAGKSVPPGRKLDILTLGDSGPDTAIKLGGDHRATISGPLRLPDWLGKLGGSLMGTAFVLAIGYVISTRALGQPSAHPTSPNWPYYLCGALFMVGLLLYGGAARPLEVGELAFGITFWVFETPLGIGTLGLLVAVWLLGISAPAAVGQQFGGHGIHLLGNGPL
jgi:hypothetical protein